MVPGLAPPVFGSSDEDKVGREERPAGDQETEGVASNDAVLSWTSACSTSGLLGLSLLVY